MPLWKNIHIHLIYLYHDFGYCTVWDLLLFSLYWVFFLTMTCGYGLSTWTGLTTEKKEKKNQSLKRTEWKVNLRQFLHIKYWHINLILYKQLKGIFTFILFHLFHIGFKNETQKKLRIFLRKIQEINKVTYNLREILTWFWLDLPFSR